MRFLIRDLLWATLIVAMGVAWWIDSEEKRRIVQQVQGLSSLLKQQELVDIINEEGGMDKVHSLHHIWSRWYGAEFEIIWIEGTPSTKVQVLKDGKVLPSSQSHWTMIHSNPDPPRRKSISEQFKCAICGVRTHIAPISGNSFCPEHCPGHKFKPWKVEGKYVCNQCDICGEYKEKEDG